MTRLPRKMHEYNCMIITSAQSREKVTSGRNAIDQISSKIQFTSNDTDYLDLEENMRKYGVE